MTAITFPNSPSSGDTHTAGNGIVYTYDGEKWTSIGTNSAGTWTRSGTEVSLTNAGDDLNVDSGTLFVDASTDRVGIGTTTPAAPLSVDAAAGVATVCLFKSPTANAYVQLGNSANDQGYIGYESSDLAFYTAGTQKARIDSSGNVGVGTSSPASLGSGFTEVMISGNTEGAGLQLQDIDGNVKAGIFTSDNSNTAIVRTITNHPLAFRTNNTEAMRIDSSGRLLVGTSSTSADTHLVVQGRSGDATSYGAIFVQRGGAGANGQDLAQINFGDNSSNIYANIRVAVDETNGASDYPGRMMFSTTADGASSPTERIRINSAGTVSSYAVNSPSFTIRNGSSAGTSVVFIQGLYSASGNVSGGAASFYVYTNGNVQNTNNSYGAISDVKLKENIVDASSQWDDIKALQIRKYNFIEGQTHTQIGVVAQEIETVSPGLVYESPDRDEEGNDLGTVTKSVNYSVLYMKAVKALQEAMERIETLEQRLSDAGIA